MMVLKWDMLIHCPKCGMKTAALDPRYDRSFPSLNLNGWVNVQFACTACHSRGFIEMYIPPVEEFSV